MAGKRIKTVDAWATEPARVSAVPDSTTAPAEPNGQADAGKPKGATKYTGPRLEVRPSDADYRRLETLAEADGRSVRSYALRLLLDALDRAEDLAGSR